MNEFILRNLLNDKNTEIYCFDEIDSTNAFASEKAKEKTECVVTAARQTQGRGRRGRGFVSETGGLYMSVVTKAPGAPFDVMHFPLLAALAVSNAIESTCSAAADIKWPNDILIKGKKVCGILMEMTTVDDDCFLITGVGINVTNEIPKDLRDKAGTLKELSGAEPEMEVLAAAVANQLSAIYKNGISQQELLLGQVQDKCITIGKKVTAMSTNVTGVAEGIDNKGSLILRLADGSAKSVIFGDVTIMSEL